MQSKENQMKRIKAKMSSSSLDLEKENKKTNIECHQCNL